MTLECSQCERRNYIPEQNRHNDRDRMELPKYCRWRGSQTDHKKTC
ncbi:MAG: 50S ribosomal protein L33 [Actinomycetota bacterium]